MSEYRLNEFRKLFNDETITSEQVENLNLTSEDRLIINLFNMTLEHFVEQYR